MSSLAGVDEDDERVTAPGWLNELFPRPWRVHSEGSCAAILAKDGTCFIRGINNEKAVLIVLAVNALAA